jgi:phage terminase small subunit
MSTPSHLSALPSVNEGRVASADLGILSEIPDMPVKLSTKEKKIWTHVALALKEYGLIHRTDGLTLTVICKTFCSWVDSEQELDRYKEVNGGSFITESANGYRAPHPLYYIARDHKKALLDWLPEAALTIPSFQKIKGDKVSDSQGSLFDDPIEKFRSQKSAIGMRIVGK